jgi:hypothetical protein
VSVVPVVVVAVVAAGADDDTANDANDDDGASAVEIGAAVAMAEGRARLRELVVVDEAIVSSCAVTESLRGASTAGSASAARGDDNEEGLPAGSWGMISIAPADVEEFAMGIGMAVLLALMAPHDKVAGGTTGGLGGLPLKVMAAGRGGAGAGAGAGGALVLVWEGGLVLPPPPPA